jgi:mRNA interferase RelE/StbE
MIVEFDKSFEKSLYKVHDQKVLGQLKKIVLQIEKSPSLINFPRLKKLSGYSDYYRIRIGDYRIGIELINENIVRFIIIANRKDIYRMFP